MADSNYNDKANSFSLSWETILDEYKQALETVRKSPKTISGYLENLRRYFIFLEAHGLMKSVHKLDKRDLGEYLRYLQNSVRWPNNPHISEDHRGRLSPFTVRAYVRDIKTFWSWLYKEGYIDNNPLAAFSLPAVPENLVRTVTPEQFLILHSSIDRSTLEGSKYYCMLLIPYDNGVRVSELVTIRVTNINFQDKTIKVMGKGQIERLVPITVYTRRQIMKYIDGVRSNSCPENCPYLFADLDGEPISINSVYQFMRRLLAKSKLKEVKFYPHILRHSFATQFLANGGNIADLKRILGHKSLATTIRYTHSQLQDIQKQHAKFSPVAELFMNKT